MLAVFWASLTGFWHTHLSLLLLQLCLCLLDFVNKHLSHFLLFLLELAQELFPFGLVCFLEAGEESKQNPDSLDTNELGMGKRMPLCNA